MSIKLIRVTSSKHQNVQMPKEGFVFQCHFIKQSTEITINR